jgi:phosphoglycolate phosphatase-like HAD superfamily hydrolase
MTPADPAQALRDFQPRKKFFVGIDSDGCVFDTMEIKHKECFAPMFIRHFHLQAASKFARQTWEFVNLYSQSRGCNRFPALALSLGLLRRRPEALARQVAIYNTQALEQWIAHAGKLSEGALAAEIKAGRQELVPLLDWSKAVNAAIADIVHGVPPFPLVREVLEKIAPLADVMVISQTPAEALSREWAEHGLDKHVRLIAGQEMGSKSEHLQWAAAGKYPRENILMIGDAPGDHKAAQSNHALFFPIVPNREEESWQELFEEGLDRFFAGKFAGEYEQQKFAEFDASLPASPPWKEIAVSP